ncbi:MAG: hypothetical protein AAF563_03590 [Pseudomonadota bacterium]
MNSTSDVRTREDLVREYKAILRELVDLRPSGTRQKIAEALDKHKSFVSQITNPTYSVPIPADDVPVIVKVCHLSPAERQRFLTAYAAAHPNRSTGGSGGSSRKAAPSAGRQVVITMPDLGDTELEAYLEDTIRQTAKRLINLARRRQAKD